MVYAGFWRRFMAYIIDGILISAVLAVLEAIGLHIFATAEMMTGSEDYGAKASLTPLGAVIFIIGYWLYEAFMYSGGLQATIGKLALGVKVVGLDGQRISFARASGRHFAKYLSGMILMIGYIMAAFTERKRALHDMLAGTLVIRA